MLKISRASDTIFGIFKTSSQDVNAFLGRSDYPHMYDRDDLEYAFSDGWNHYPDEPDLLHKTTDRGMTFSIHPGPRYGAGEEEKPYFMALHNPEGVSPSGWFDTLGQAMQAEKNITSRRKMIKDHLAPDGYQNEYARIIHDDNDNGQVFGVTHTVDQARDSLERMKASEEAIAAGGESLRDNLGEAYRRRGL